jgi:Kae1-associated kinase Bud32
MSKQGAEAWISFEGGEVSKQRREKEYRHPELDERLREERTETEIRLMKDARHHGVPVPEILEEDSTGFRMEEVDGEMMKDVLDPELFRSLGENVAILHSIDVIHGDLTTSNVMVENSEIRIIDFGLAFRSQRIEDRAVDIYLLKQVLESSHPVHADSCWEKFLDGYRDYEKSGKVLERFEEVKERGRYK